MVANESLPTRGVWIEIRDYNSIMGNVNRGHSPHGECGLKFCSVVCGKKCILSLPTRGVWIEISAVLVSCGLGLMSLPTRGVWIEILRLRRIPPCSASLPTRGVWIEIVLGQNAVNFPL